MKWILLVPLVCLFSCGVPKSPVERQMIGFMEKFDRWDENGDGKLALSELQEAERISGVDAMKILEFYDTDGDGMITLRESQAAMSNVERAEKLADQ